jgi:hypothetical protein
MSQGNRQLHRRQHQLGCGDLTSAPPRNPNSFTQRRCGSETVPARMNGGPSRLFGFAGDFKKEAGPDGLA